jgi:hypothetical protein
MVILLALLAVLCGQEVQAYYNASTGRWLSRDPIGEEVFLASYSTDKPRHEVRRLRREGLKSPYLFVGNNALNFIDLLGLEVLLETHPVALGNNHSKIVMIVDCNSKFFKDPRFKNIIGTDGKKVYATLGAGPVGGHLVSNVNRPTDVDRSNNKYSAKVGPSDQAAEDIFIAFLFALDAKYKDKLDYELLPLPWTDGYNSNGYVSGLLNAATGKMPAQPSNTPGFQKPVPAKHFK